MSKEKEVKGVFAIDPGTENVNQFDGILHQVQQGDVNASKSVYKAGEDFTPGGWDDILVAEGLLPTNGSPSEEQQVSIEVTFTDDSQNPLHWEGLPAKAFPVSDKKGLEHIPPFPFRRTGPDGGTEHIERQISCVPDHETFEDGVVISAALAEESEREEKNYEALVEIVKCPSELEMFTRIKQVIIEKDVRIFDKMSRRRKKIYVSRVAFYEVQTGKYTTRKHKGHPGFKPRPVRLRYTELHGSPMETLFKDWCALL